MQKPFCLLHAIQVSVLTKTVSQYFFIWFSSVIGKCTPLPEKPLGNLFLPYDGFQYHFRICCTYCITTICFESNHQRRELSKAQFCLQELRLICSHFWWKANGNNLMHFQQKENFCLSIKNFIHSSNSKKKIRPRQRNAIMIMFFYIKIQKTLFTKKCLNKISILLLRSIYEQIYVKS